MKVHELLLSPDISNFLLAVELMKHLDDDELYEELWEFFHSQLDKALNNEPFRDSAVFFSNAHRSSKIILYYFKVNVYIDFSISDIISFSYDTDYKLGKKIRLHLSCLTDTGVPFTKEKVRRHSKQIRDAFFNIRNRINQGKC